jgi:hypothetical protein
VLSIDHNAATIRHFAKQQDHLLGSSFARALLQDRDGNGINATGGEFFNHLPRLLRSDEALAEGNADRRGFAIDEFETETHNP